MHKFPELNLHENWRVTWLWMQMGLVAWFSNFNSYILILRFLLHYPFPSSWFHLGAGIGPTIQIGEQTVITVDAKAAGKGKVTCTVCTPDGTEVDVDVVENEDGTFDIFYTAPQPGKYVICVRFGGEHIPNSPFQVTVSEEDIMVLNSSVHQ